MGCFLMHKWKGCICTKCGQVRDKDHRFEQVPGKCLEKCAGCGQERIIPHRFLPAKGRCAAICEVCGEERPIIHSFKDGRCERCGIERASLGTPEYVEASDQYPQNGNGAALAGWLDGMIKKYRGAGSWELLEPAVRKYADCYEAFTMKLKRSGLYGKDLYSETTCEEYWGTFIADYCLNLYMQERMPNGYWDTAEKKRRLDNTQVLAGQVHPGVMVDYLKSKIVPHAAEDAAEVPMKLPEVIADQEHCDKLIKCFITVSAAKSQDAVPDSVYLLLTEAVKGAFETKA